MTTAADRTISPSSVAGAGASGIRKPLDPSLRYSILVRDKFACRYCGRSTRNTPGLVLEVDHILPASRGGTDTPDNLVTACAECNRGKGKRVDLSVVKEAADLTGTTPVSSSGWLDWRMREFPALFLKWAGDCWKFSFAWDDMNADGNPMPVQFMENVLPGLFEEYGAEAVGQSFRKAFEQYQGDGGKVVEHLAAFCYHAANPDAWARVELATAIRRKFCGPKDDQKTVQRLVNAGYKAGGEDFLLEMRNLAQWGCDKRNAPKWETIKRCIAIRVRNYGGPSIL